MNPLHVDNDVSKSAGFPSPIMHGMCTMGIVARAVVENVLAFDESRISSMKVNFSSVCYPGETLKNEIWIDGKVISLKTTSIDRDKVVIDNSYIISN
jgi:acyl dehydratase